MKKIIEEITKRNFMNQGGIYEKERGDVFRQIIGVGKKVMDIGARHGSLTKHFIEGNDLTGVDIDEENLQILKDKFHCSTIALDLNEDLDVLGVGLWDAIVMSEVIEHIFYPEKKVEQISRLLKSDGVFVGSVPNGFSLMNRIRLFLGKAEGTTMADPTHVFHFSYRRLKTMLEKHFTDVEILPMQKSRYMFLARISPNLFGFLLVFICKKPIIKKEPAVIV